MKKLRIKDKFVVYSGLSTIFTSLTFFAFAAFEIFFTNKEELWFSLWDILFPFLFLTLCAAAVLLWIVFHAREISKTRGNVIVSLIFSLGLGFYIQGNYIVANYGVLDGKAINWENYTFIMVVDAAIWLVCFITPLVLLRKKPKWFETIVQWGSSLIIGIEIITLAVLFVTVGAGQESKPVFTTENQFHVSNQKNVIVFLTDALDASFTDEMLEQYPEIYTEFKDFTYYSDTSGICPTTKGSLPFILTGEVYLNEQTYRNYLEKAYQQSAILKTAAENGYEVDLYTEDFVSANSLESVATNAHTVESKISDTPEFLEYYLRLISFRYMPDILKPTFWISGNEFDAYRSVKTGFQTYSIDNYSFYRDLTEQGISADRSAPVMKVYHIQGAHSPLLIDENVNSVHLEDTSRVRTVRGCFRIIGEYISQLKALGLYDNAFIVIMADHGSAFPQCPTLMIKEPDKNQEKLNVDLIPASYVLNWADIMKLALDGGENSVHDTILSGQRQTRPFYFYTWDGSADGKYLPDIYEYQIPSHARKMELSKDQTGKVYKKPGERKAYRYKIGEEISISDDVFYQNAIQEGFFLTADRKYAWLGSRAQIELLLNKEPKSNLKLKLSVATVNGYSQTMELRVNGIQLNESSTIYLGELDREWIIPKRLLNGKKLILEFSCPEAAEYHAVVGNVSIGISSFSIVDTEEEQIQEILPVPLDHKVVIEMGDASKIDDTVQVRGFYQDGGAAAWTAERATFKFTASATLSSAAFTIVYGTYYRELDAVITLNGHEIGRLQEAHGTGIFELPGEYFNQDGLQTVEILVPNATSPFLYGESPDRRTLGLCVSSVEITPTIATQDG